MNRPRSFTGTYTLGSAGNTVTLNGGIIKNTGSGTATIVSPVTPQPARCPHRETSEAWP